MKKSSKVLLSRVLASVMLVSSIFTNVAVVGADELSAEGVESGVLDVAASGSAITPVEPVKGDDYSFNFTDGSVIPTDVDGSLDYQAEYFKILVGNQNAYKFNDSTHGMSFKTGNAIELPVAGPVTVKFGACQYSKAAATISAVNADGTYSLTQSSGGLQCTDTIDFVYDGPASTLTFSFDDQSYVPSLEVIAAKDGAVAIDAEKNVIYNFDFTQDTLTNEGTYGLMTIAANGTAPGFNGPQHGVEFKDGNTLTFKVAGNSYIKIGGCQYSGGGNYTATATAAGAQFENTSLTAKTSGCYDGDGSSVDFLYVGDAGEVTITCAGGKAYIPNISIVPIPTDVDLVAWTQKDISLTINGTTVDITGAATSADNSVVTLGAGTVLSANTDACSIMVDLGGNALDATMVAGTVTDATYEVVGSDIVITYTDGTKPYTYTITVGDSSLISAPEYSKTYNYVFTDAYYEKANYAGTVYSDDMFVTIDATTWNGSSHGIDFAVGKSISVQVAGDAELTFGGCQYSRGLATVTNAAGDVLASGLTTQTTHCYHNSSKAVEGETYLWTYSYEGPATTLTFTFDGSVYIPNLEVVNADAPEIIVLADEVKVDSWDFNGTQLADAGVVKYNNNLTQTILNDFTGNTQGFSTAKGTVLDFGGNLKFTGDVRFYNTGTGSYQLVDDAKKSDVEGVENPVTHTYTDENGATTVFEGFLYANGATNLTHGNQRFFELSDVKKGDKISFYYAPANGTVEGAINYLYTGEYGTDSGSIDTATEFSSVWAGNAYYAEFVATCDGPYEFWVSNLKAEYMRIQRTPKTFFEVKGNLNVPSNIPSSYKLAFTNTTTGDVRYATINGATYSAALPYGFEYNVAIEGANGFIVSQPDPSVVNVDGNKDMDVAVVQIPLVTVAGSITGVDETVISNMELVFTPDTEKIYVPEQTISGSSISVVLEPNVNYTVTANGINDYEIVGGGTVNVTTDVNDYVLALQAKPVYTVTPDITGLTSEQLAKLQLTFTNLNEEGYSYTFSPATETIVLRDGSYSISYSGIDEYPVKMKLTSNITIADAGIAKAIEFKPVDNWKFMVDYTAENAASGLFQGLQLTNTSKDGNKYLTGTDSVIKVPVKPGEGIVVDYTYQADFYFDDPANAVHTESKSTNIVETTGFAYNGTTDGFITITFTAKTYLRNIRVVAASEYKADLYVGADKEYKTINAALDAVYTMNRPNDERVTINIDPGNYEEMINVGAKNVTFKNSSVMPSTALTDLGVGIDPNAVRITSYYGTGYNYYSQGDNYKWDAETLAVNKENDSWSIKNAGGTSTTLWNATVCVYGEGFKAEGIIFENSFNQYISEKEANDVVVLTSEGKGERNYPAGSTDVQNKSHVERAAALAVMADKVVFDNCRFVGRQDTLYGQYDLRAYFKDCDVMGATDYIFGGMIAVFDNCNLVMNTSDDKNDYCYITAAQQKAGRGFLFYNCNVVSTTPGVDTASLSTSKQGFFGRPWQKDTSEAVFYNTTIGTTTRKVTGHGTASVTIEDSQVPVSLIYPAGWLSTLGGESVGMMEYGTVELSGEDNAASRVTWSTMLTEPLLDGQEITPYLFTQGTDSWNPVIADRVQNARGDVDGDGFVTSNDAAIVLNYALNPNFTGFEKYDFTVADVDGDNAVNANDSAYILQKALNIETIFPVDAVPAPPATTVYVVGDSTACDYSASSDPNYYYKRVGFGTKLNEYLKEDVTVVNYALSGRSSKSFLTEANYQLLLDNMQAGDYLLIAFGHNDEKAEAARYTNPNGDKDTEGSFQNSLYVNYIKPAQDKGVTPILATPIVRRTAGETFSNSQLHITTDSGTFAGGDYPQAIRDLGAATGVPVIDSTELTKNLYTTLTSAETLNLHAWTSSKPGSVDNTHLNNYGASYVSYLLADAMKSIDGISAYVKDGIAAPDKATALIVNPNYKETVVGELTKSTLWTTSEPWWGSVFGDVGGASKIYDADAEGNITGLAATEGVQNFEIKELEDGSVTLRAGIPASLAADGVTASSFGKIAGASDGMAAYFQRIDAGANFEISATANIIDYMATNNQVAFGLIADTVMAIDTSDAGVYGNYVATGIFKANNINAAEPSPIWTTVQRNIDNATSLAPVGEPTLTTAPVAGESINLRLRKVGNTYTLWYGDQAPVTTTMEATGGEVYIGLFTSRCAAVNYTNISYTNEVTE